MTRPRSLCPMGTRDMNPTATTNPALAFGVLKHQHADHIVFGIPHTDYELHLQVDEPLDLEPGKPLRGRIFAQALRIDKARGGGRYIEPIYGRPRRLQGRIVATEPATNTITVHCGCPIQCVLGPRQQIPTFDVGDFVTFDIERGARFVPIQ